MLRVTRLVLGFDWFVVQLEAYEMPAFGEMALIKSFKKSYVFRFMLYFTKKHNLYVLCFMFHLMFYVYCFFNLCFML